MTALVACTLQEKDNDTFGVLSTIFFMNGIIFDIDQRLWGLELKREPGWMVSTHWIALKDELRGMFAYLREEKYSNPDQKEVLKGQPLLGIIDHLHSNQATELKLSCPISVQESTTTLQGSECCLEYDSKDQTHNLSLSVRETTKWRNYKIAQRRHVSNANTRCITIQLSLE